jgi:hypothetical protein
MTLKHDPIRPVRQEVLGEFVFIEQWQQLMAANPNDLDSDDNRTWLELILREMGFAVEQRHATVAASLVCWFGTNCGGSFLETGKKAAAVVPRRAPAAWVGAWAQENYRIMGVAGGYRTLEHILALDSDRTAQGLVSLVRTPDLSVDDFEVAEHVCAWLGSWEGGEFLKRCEARIEELRQAGGGNAGRIIPSESIAGAVWVTPFFSRDSEELRIAGKVIGGWKKLGDTAFEAFISGPDDLAKPESLADTAAARIWVEAHAFRVVEAEAT